MNVGTGKFSDDVWHEMMCRCCVSIVSSLTTVRQSATSHHQQQQQTGLQRQRLATNWFVLLRPALPQPSQAALPAPQVISFVSIRPAATSHTHLPLISLASQLWQVRPSVRLSVTSPHHTPTIRLHVSNCLHYVPARSTILATVLWNGLPNTLKKVSSIKKFTQKVIYLFCGQQTPIVRISSCVSNVTNYYSVTDNIFLLIVDFWHNMPKVYNKQKNIISYKPTKNRHHHHHLLATYAKSRQ